MLTHEQHQQSESEINFHILSVLVMIQITMFVWDSVISNHKNK